MLDMYAAMWRSDARRQVLLILVALGIAALAAVPLSYQKSIINELTAKDIELAGLVRLCAGMMGVILLSLSLKWVHGYWANTLGEDVTRRLRKQIYATALSREQDTELNSGTVTTMISAEAEELGKFAGSAFSEPVLQIGTMISVVGYIATSEPVLGLIALAIVAPQVILVLTTQQAVNRYVAERVRILRKSTRDIVADNLGRENPDVLAAFDGIYETRRSMFLWKLSTKTAISAITAAGMVGVLFLGGWYVLKGDTDVGTVVAAVIGLTRLQGPTSFMIAFYRQVSASRVKFELLKDVAMPRGWAPSEPSRSG